MSTRNAGNGKHGKSGVKNTTGARSTGNTRGSGSMGSSRGVRGAGDSRSSRSAGSSRSAASSGRARSEGDARNAARGRSQRSSAGTGRKRSAGNARDYDEIKRPAGRKPSSKKKKAAKRRRRAILFGVEILILVVMLGFLYTVLKTEKVERIKIDEEKVVMEMNENVETNEVMKGYRNIALFGVDSREGSLGKGTRSDTIIIPSTRIQAR